MEFKVKGGYLKEVTHGKYQVLEAYTSEGDYLGTFKGKNRRQAENAIFDAASRGK